MNQTSYSPDKFGTYLSHPGSQGCDIDLSSANVLEILLAYRAFRQTYNAYEVPDGGRGEKMLRSQICQDIRTVHFL